MGLVGVRVMVRVGFGVRVRVREHLGDRVRGAVQQ